MNEPLLRPEVSEHRRRRSHGEVVLGQSLSAQVVMTAIAVVAIAVALWISLDDFARIETARGALVTELPSAKTIAPAQGVVTTLSASEGVRVSRGQRIAMVMIDRRAEHGRGYVGEGLEAVRPRMRSTGFQVQLKNARASGERGRVQAMLAAAASEAEQLG